jgi:PAS domain S-box-containing protein
MSSLTTRRSVTYWAFFTLFLLGGGPIFSADWMASPFLHTFLDGVALFGAVVAAILVVRAYRKTGATALGVAAVAFTGAAAFELLHELSSSALLAPFMTSESFAFMPWSWHASRMFLAMGLVAAAVHARRENYGTEETVSQKRFPSPRLFALFTLVCVTVGSAALLRADLPSVYYSSVGLIRLPEVISGSVFLTALLIFVWRGNWRSDSYGHWMNIALVASLNAQIFCMAFSQELFDTSFTAAHILKIVAYGCIVYGFALPHKATSLLQAADAHKPKGVGLGIKVALLCGFIGFICVMPIAYKSSQTLHEIAAVNGIENLSAAAVNTGSAIENQRARSDADLGYLVSTNVVDGINRANQNGGRDSETGQTRKQLIVNLSRLAQNLLLADTEYLSLAYVDAASGKPVVRSEQRSGSGLAAVNRTVLESSERALAQKTLAGDAEIVRSNVFLVRDAADENNLQVEGTALAVRSAATGSVEGVLILHSDVSTALLSAGLPNVETLAYVVNSKGEFLRHPDPARAIAPAGTEMQAASFTLADQFPGLNFNVAGVDGQASGTIYKQPDGTEVLLGFERPVATLGGGEPLLYINTGRRDDMEQTAATIGFQLQQIAQFNLLVAIVIGWFFARRFAKPVQVISAAAVEFGRSGAVSELPVDGRDEIGLLGKSLSGMMNEVASQREKLMLLSSAVESSIDSTIITTITGDIEYVNPHYELYAGIAASQVLGMNIMDLREFKENRHILSKDPSEKGGETVWTGALTTRRADGKRHDEEITIAPIRNADGEIVNQSLVIEDVTERRAMEKFIESKTAELQRSNRDLEQFAYVASHDLKAPLRAIEVLVSWLKDDLEEVEDGDVQENLDLLSKRTARLSRLLDDLLAYSRAGRKIGDIKNIDAKEFVEDIASLISPPAGFVIEADSSLPAMKTYHAPLETVFRNLMSNAIKHSPVPEEGRIRVYADDQGDLIQFSVQDNGSGIPQEYAEKVFKMFQTLQARDEKEGSGMGLAIVQRIIDWQGGKIWFEDGPDGKGTVFHFTWRKTAVQAPEITAEDDDAMSETQTLRAQAEAESAAEKEAQFGDEVYEERTHVSIPDEKPEKSDV